MAKAFLLSAIPKGDPAFPDFAHEDLERLRRCAAVDKYRVHNLASDPYEADLILFVERGHAAGRYLEHVRKHAFLAQLREKCFVCNSRYMGIPLLPGIYGQVRSGDCFRQGRIKSGHYTEIYDKPHIRYGPDAVERRYLYSFVGAVSTWPAVRERLSRLNHPRGLFMDTSKAKDEVRNMEKEAERSYYHQSYVEIINTSQFVLCPRGDAPSSMRLFEAMKMGRVPVVISDEFLYPEGPQWNTFSVHVAERDIASIPEILEALEGRAEEMGHLARQAYETWFAEDVYFHHVVEWCLDIKRNGMEGESLLHYLEYCKILRPYQFRRFASTQYRKVRKRVEPQLPAGTRAQV